MAPPEVFMENWRWRLEISVSYDELVTADPSAGQQLQCVLYQERGLRTVFVSFGPDT